MSIISYYSRQSEWEEEQEEEEGEEGGNTLDACSRTSTRAKDESGPGAEACNERLHPFHFLQRLC